MFVEYCAEEVAMEEPLKYFVYLVKMFVVFVFWKNGLFKCKDRIEIVHLNARYPEGRDRGRHKMKHDVSGREFISN